MSTRKEVGLMALCAADTKLRHLKEQFHANDIA